MTKEQVLRDIWDGLKFWGIVVAALASIVLGAVLFVEFIVPSLVLLIITVLVLCIIACWSAGHFFRSYP